MALLLSQSTLLLWFLFGVTRQAKVADFTATLLKGSTAKINIQVSVPSTQTQCRREESLGECFVPKTKCLFNLALLFLQILLKKNPPKFK